MLLVRTSLPDSLLRHISLVALLCLATISLAGCSDQNVALDEADQKLIAADAALADGNDQLAIEELTASIEARPNEWAYYRRAQLYVKTGDHDKALADCEAGLALDAAHADLQWLHGELSKPAARRFKGRRAEPPGKSK